MMWTVRATYPCKPSPAAASSGAMRRARARLPGLLRAAAALLALAAIPAFPAELVVVDQAGCPYCARFEREIAPAWPNTDEGRDVPLRRVDLHSDWPADLASVAPATLTPTFILVEDGEELGRLVGYAGDDHFWFLIGQLLEERAGQRGSGPSTPSDTLGDAARESVGDAAAVSTER